MNSHLERLGSCIGCIQTFQCSTSKGPNQLHPYLPVFSTPSPKLSPPDLKFHMEQSSKKAPNSYSR